MFRRGSSVLTSYMMVQHLLTSPRGYSFFLAWILKLYQLLGMSPVYDLESRSQVIGSVSLAQQCFDVAKYKLTSILVVVVGLGFESSATAGYLVGWWCTLI